MKRLGKVSLAFVMVSLLLTLTVAAHAEETITLAIHAVPHATGVYMFQDQFYEQHGIKVKVVEMPPEAIYEKQMTEFVAGGGAFDVVQFNPPWIADYSRHLEPLEPLAEKYGLDFKLADLVPAFRDMYCSWEGVWYGMPWDGDVHIFYYNKIAFDNEEYKKKFEEKYGYALKPPETWDQYKDVAEFFSGWDWDNDGEIEYGAAEYLKRGRMYWWFLDRFAAFGGVYFDENMTPLINTAAGTKALEHMIACLSSYPPGVLDYSYMELRTAFTKGDIAMCKQWTCVGKASQDPKESKIVGNVGFGTIPGARWDGDIYHRPMIAGGWNLGIPKYSKHKEAAIRFLHFITSPEISLQITKSPDTSLDPYRLSHYQSSEFRALWPTAGEYLDAIDANLAIGFPDLLIPGAAEYMDKLDYALCQALAGGKTPKQALDDTAKAWNEVTDRLGREKQMALWNAQYDAMKKQGIVYKEWKE